MALQDDAVRELLARIAKLAHEATPGEVHELASAVALLRQADTPTEAAAKKT